MLCDVAICQVFYIAVLFETMKLENKLLKNDWK